MVAVGEPSHPALQALVRWDPAGFAGRELDDRPVRAPAARLRLATLTATEDDVAPPSTPWRCRRAPRCWARSRSPAGRPPDPDAPAPARAVVRVPRAAGAALSRTLTEMQGIRSARKQPTVRVQVDPVALE